jgi:hypothetical protein
MASAARLGVLGVSYTPGVEDARRPCRVCSNFVTAGNRVVPSTTPTTLTQPRVQTWVGPAESWSSSQRPCCGLRSLHFGSGSSGRWPIRVARKGGRFRRRSCGCRRCPHCCTSPERSVIPPNGRMAVTARSQGRSSHLKHQSRKSRRFVEPTPEVHSVHLEPHQSPAVRDHAAVDSLCPADSMSPWR